MIKHRNQYNNREFERDNEKFTLPSMTIPDQSMSIKEILERYARGLPMDGKVPIYEGEDGDGIDPRRLDLAEREHLKKVYTEELEEIKKQLGEITNLENTVSPAGTEGEKKE